MPAITLIGCGYLGLYLANASRRAGHTVAAVVRSDSRAGYLRELGMAARAVDFDQAQGTLTGLAGDVLYYLVPPPNQGRLDTRLENCLQALEATRPRRCVLVSTSGVYGDCAGEWVDETRPPAPQVDRARRRLDAEQRFQRWCETRDVEWVILRVAGIYGPGRLPQARLLRGEPVLNEAESPWSNRIHVEDLCRLALAAGVPTAATGVFNAADGRPGSMTDYFNRVADHLGIARPPQISMHEAERTMSPGMLSYLRESRRLSIRRARAELGFEPRLAGLEAGLAAC